MLTLKGRRVPLRLVPTLFLLSNHEDGDDDNHEDGDGDGDEDDGVQENEYDIAPLFEGYYEKNTRMLSSSFLGINMKKSVEI